MAQKESGHFARDRGDDHGWLLGGGDEPAIAGAETELRLPGDGAHGFRQLLKSDAQSLADACRVAVSPRTLDEYAPGPPIAGQGGPPRYIVSPVERSPGTRPRNARN